ncbi:MAG: hypothetical protein UHP28_08030 [Treponema sp.]|nr:hypothetical protein [Treponema sp.]
MTRSRIFTKAIAALVIALAIIFPANLYSEKLIDQDFDITLDLPEDFIEAEHTPDSFSYRFAHRFMAVSFLYKLYPMGQFQTSSQALTTTLGRLGASYQNDSFVWANADCSIANFSMTFQGSSNGAKGWAISVQLKEKEASLVLLCYADSDKADDCQQFIISCLNSLTINEESKLCPGIFTSYAFPADKSLEAKKITLNIAGKQIQTQIDQVDKEASAFVRDCEFAVFSLYASHEKWLEAWKRYYQTIYRDSYSRMKVPADHIHQALYQTAKQQNSKNPDAAYNKMLLNWVQGFDYIRNTSAKKSDFTTPSEILCGNGSDCDARSMLLCTLLEHAGIDCTLFVSREYKHSVYGALINQEGAKIQVGQNWYLLGETTAKNINPGLIAQDQRDTKKWIPVPLP